MTIQGAFNDITKKLGGTPDKTHTIRGSIDALVDTLAGSNQPREATIEQEIRKLGEYIGTGGGGDTEYSITCYQADNEDLVLISDSCGLATFSNNAWSADTAIAKAHAGDVIALIDKDNLSLSNVISSLNPEDFASYPCDRFSNFVMPAHDVLVLVADK